jgi:hypothetical protein
MLNPLESKYELVIMGLNFANCGGGFLSRSFGISSIFFTTFHPYFLSPSFTNLHPRCLSSSTTTPSIDYFPLLTTTSFSLPKPSLSLHFNSPLITGSYLSCH